MKLEEAFTLLTEGRSQKININDAVDYIKQNCKDFVKLMGSHDVAPVFRGKANYDNILLVEPSSSIRRSRNTSNYYTYFIDNSKEWKLFPDRSRSIICTTSRINAEDYGNCFTVIPKDDAVFGICPESDLWDSFSFVFKTLNIRNMHQFNAIVKKTGKAINLFLGNNESFSDDDSSIKKLEQNFEKLLGEVSESSEIAMNPKVREYLGVQNEKVEKMLEVFFDNLGVQSGMDYLLSPHKNDIKLAEYPIKNNLVKGGYYGKEVWTDSNCILVETDYMDVIRQKLQK